MSGILEIGQRVLALRKAKVGDLQSICAVERIAHSHPWSIHKLEPEFSHPWSRFRLAFLRDPVGIEEEELVGYCLSWLLPGELHILNVAVLPAFRRKGVARQLMEDAMRLARVAEAEQIFLEVRLSNAPAIGLYQSLGFTQVGYRKKYYDRPVEDALVFVLVL